MREGPLMCVNSVRTRLEAAIVDHQHPLPSWQAKGNLAGANKIEASFAKTLLTVKLENR